VSVAPIRGAELNGHLAGDPHQHPADRRHDRTRLIAVVALVAVTAVWGSTFALSKDLTTRMTVTDYLACRFLAAAVLVAAVRPRVVLSMDRRTALAGVILGALYTTGQLLQFLGLQHTAPTVSAFVVSLYVVFTPMLAALWHRRRPTAGALLAAAVATAGVATMSLRAWTFESAEFLILAAAALYAVHILALGAWSTAAAAYQLTFAQLLTMGLLLLMLAAPDGIDPPLPADWVSFGYLALVAGGLALLVQTWAQAHLPSASVAVVMVLEPVWAAAIGALYWREHLDARTLAGGTLVVGAMLLVVARTGPAGRSRAKLVRRGPT
jgi:drug/metabolite transporter (DMT)-like permease